MLRGQAFVSVGCMYDWPVFRGEQPLPSGPLSQRQRSVRSPQPTQAHGQSFWFLRPRQRALRKHLPVTACPWRDLVVGGVLHSVALSGRSQFSVL